MKYSIKQRIWAIVLTLAMIVPMLPVMSAHVHAAGSLTVTDANIGLSWTDASSNKGKASWSASGNNVTGTATGYTQYVVSKKNVTTKLTITNNHSDDRTLSFDYTLTGGGSVSGTISGTSGSYSATLAAGASTTITLTSPGGSGNTNTLTITGLQLLASGNVTATFLPGENGSYTVDGTAVTAQTTKEKAATEVYTLNATPASGYKFFGWWSNASNSYVSYDNPASVKFGSDPQLKPVFIGADTALFGVGAARFADLTEAANYASTATTKTIVLLNNGTLRGQHTIPAGVTLLIPFDDSNTLYTNEPACTSSFLNNVAWVKPTAYRTLTMAADAKITVNGAMSLSAKHAAANGGSNYCGSPTGPVSFVTMQEGANITINNGGKLYAWGFITGSGSVTANSGATVYENFQVTDFRGGTATGAYADNGLAFPLNQYYVQNIEVPVTFYAGASEKIYTSAYSSSMCLSGEATFIGTGGMFTSGTGGYVVKDYDESRDRLNVDLYGSCELNSMTVKFSIEVDSANYLLPITNNVSIGIHSGTTTLKQSVALLPGVEITVDQGATLNLAYSGTSINDYCTDGYNIIVYDRDEWFYGLSLDEATMGEEITGVKYGLVLHSNAPVPNGYSAKPSYFAPVLYAPGRTGGRTDADLKDAVLNINGTLVANGFIYTTIGGASIISSEKTGKIEMVGGAGADMITCQNNGTTSTTLGLMIRSAWLQNGDGSYLQTMVFDEETGDVISAAEPGTIYEYCSTHDCWYTGECDKCIVTYTITWVIDGNEYTSTVNAGELPEVPDEVQLTKTGYTFTGWDKTIVAATGNATYTAVFTPNKYTVTWVDGNGNTIYTEDVDYGTVPSYNGATPTKDSTAQYTYTFKGWDKAIVAVTGNVTYEATFTETIRKYEIQWIVDGVTVDGGEVAYGTVPTFPNGTPSKDANGCTAYTFSGWDKEVVAVTGAATYTAVFTASEKHTSVVVDAAKDPTCAETGLTEGSHCEACGSVIVAQVTVPATGNHIDGNDKNHECDVCGKPDVTAHTAGTSVKENVVAPSCTADGSYDEVVYCTECGAEISRTNVNVDPLGHDWADPAYTWNGKDCTAERVCKTNAEHKESETVNATGEVTTEPTCTEKGWTTYTADFAADWAKTQTTEAQDVPATDHDWQIDGYTNDGNTHTIHYVCGNDATHTKSESEVPHNYNNADHKCDCGDVETFILTIYVLAFDEEVELTVKYGENLLEVLAKAAADKKIPAMDERIRVKDAVFNGEKVVFDYSYYVEDYGWCSVDETFTMPGTDFSIDQDAYEFGWHYSGYGVEYHCEENGWLDEGWHFIEEEYDGVPGGAWYYFSEGTGGWEDCYFRVEGVNRVPYPTESINGVTYGPHPGDVIELGDTNPDATTSLFVFDENGKFLYTLNGLCDYDLDGDGTNEKHWAVNGQLPLWLGLVQDGDDYYYFGANNEMITSNHADTNGIIYLSRDSRTNVPENDPFVWKGIYYFGEDGKLLKYDGITEIDGALYYFDNWRLAQGAGLVKVGGNYYYVRSSGKLVVNAKYWIYNVNEFTNITVGTYSFDANGVMDVNSGKNGVYAENGGLFYYVDGKLNYAGLIEYDGGYIYVRSNGQLATGKYWITKTNDNASFPEGFYTFGVDGKMILDGVVNVDGTLCYYENGKLAYKGLMEYNGGYIYVRSNGQLVTDRKYWVTKTNGLVAEDSYTFDANGMMVTEGGNLPETKNGIVAENGGLFYYVDGKLSYAGLMEYNGGYIYVRSNGQLVTDRKYWITKTNGLLEAGNYTFGADGMMITED